jgi:hypothetical protein
LPLFRTTRENLTKVCHFFAVSAKSAFWAGAGMLIRFSMFPLEPGMLPIYERLIGCPERQAGRILRSLLHQQLVPGLPAWFESLPRTPFPNHRAKTIRLTLPPSDPALADLCKTLEPQDKSERINTLKTVLGKLLVTERPAVVSARPVTETALAIVPTTTFQLRSTEPEKPKLTEEEAEAIRLEKIANSAKSFY